LDGNIEVLDDGVDTKRDSGSRPEKHHDARQAIGLLLPPVVPYLWEELDAPEDGANRSEDVRGQGGSRLGCHLETGSGQPVQSSRRIQFARS